MEPPREGSTVLKLLKRLNALLLGPDSDDEDLQPTEAYLDSSTNGITASTSLTTGLHGGSCGSPVPDSQHLLLQQLLQVHPLCSVTALQQPTYACASLSPTLFAGCVHDTQVQYPCTLDAASALDS